jgi:hypothetical protein
VNFRNKGVGIGDDHRTGLQPLAGLAVLPFVPKTGRGQDRRSSALVKYQGCFPPGVSCHS